MKKLIFYILIFVGVGFVSCSDDDMGPSIFDTTPRPKNDFDKWLEDNIRSQYNIALNYRWEDVESDMKYNLTPADLDRSIRLAKIVKYLWLETYDELTGSQDFLSTYAPKIMQFVGSPAVNPSTQTIVLGTAEGGMKITLYNVNDLDLVNPDIDKLNEYYFKTMHHEFAHILHQTKNYPTSYNEISAGKYSSAGWQNRTELEAWKLGFVTNYASSQPQEDFVEMIANYVTNPTRWKQMMENKETDVESLNKKLEIVREWLNTAWKIDLDQLRDIVTRRSADIDKIK